MNEKITTSNTMCRIERIPSSCDYRLENSKITKFCLSIPLSDPPTRTTITRIRCLLTHSRAAILRASYSVQNMMVYVLFIALTRYQIEESILNGSVEASRAIKLLLGTSLLEDVFDFYISDAPDQTPIHAPIRCHRQ